MTWLAWHASAQGYDGYLRWAYDYWRNEDPRDARDGGFTAGDFAFVYRTDNSQSMQYQSSVRFELLREGIQDFEKIALLKSGHYRDLSAVVKELLDKTLNAFTEQSGIDGKSEELVVRAQATLAAISKKICQESAEQTTTSLSKTEEK